MVQALEADIVPRLEALGMPPAEAQDLTAPDPGEPALTLVFDREGRSPALFPRLARRGHHLAQASGGEDRQETAFHRLAVPVFGPTGTGATHAALAEKPFELRGGFPVRQIRRRLDGGRH